MRVPSVVRRLGVTAAILFFVATVLLLVDRLNLVYRPPDIPETSNLVDRMVAQIPYRHDIWPIFFASNFLFGVGFVVFAGLALVLASRIEAADPSRHLLLWTLGTAGLLGAVAQLVLVGAVHVTIDNPYCDCGFRDTEIVSQLWAQMLVEGAHLWLINGASLLAAGGAAIAGRVFAGRGMPQTWSVLSYLLAGLLVLAVVLGLIGQFDAAEWLSVAVTGIVIPAWALWLGLSFDDTGRVEATG